MDFKPLAAALSLLALAACASPTPYAPAGTDQSRA